MRLALHRRFLLSSNVNIISVWFINLSGTSFALSSSKQLPINSIDEINSLFPERIVFHISQIAVEHHVFWRIQIILRPIWQSAVATTGIWILVVDERDVSFPDVVRQVRIILVFWERTKGA
jgi:hypothetical protein